MKITPKTDVSFWNRSTEHFWNNKLCFFGLQYCPPKVCGIYRKVSRNCPQNLPKSITKFAVTSRKSLRFKYPSLVSLYCSHLNFCLLVHWILMNISERRRSETLLPPRAKRTNKRTTTTCPSQQSQPSPAASPNLWSKALRPCASRHWSIPPAIQSRNLHQTNRMMPGTVCSKSHVHSSIMRKTMKFVQGFFLQKHFRSEAPVLICPWVSHSTHSLMSH